MSIRNKTMKRNFENIDVLRLDSALPWQPLAANQKIHKIDDFSGFVCLKDVILVLKDAELKDKTD